jgi:hypothetical protein
MEVDRQLVMSNGRYKISAVSNRRLLRANAARVAGFPFEIPN